MPEHAPDVIYTRQFVPVCARGAYGYYNAPVIIYDTIRSMAAWFSRGGNISTPRRVSSFGYWLPSIIAYNSTLLSSHLPLYLCFIPTFAATEFNPQSESATIPFLLRVSRPHRGILSHRVGKGVVRTGNWSDCYEKGRHWMIEAK